MVIPSCSYEWSRMQQSSWQYLRQVRRKLTSLLDFLRSGFCGRARRTIIGRAGCSFQCPDDQGAGRLFGYGRAEARIGFPLRQGSGVATIPACICRSGQLWAPEHIAATPHTSPGLGIRYPTPRSLKIHPGWDALSPTMTRASGKWRPIWVTGFERRRMEQVRSELDQEYEQENGLVRSPEAKTHPSSLSSKIRT